MRFIQGTPALKRPKCEVVGSRTSSAEDKNLLVTEGNTEGRIQVTGRRGTRRKQLLDHLKEKTGYCKLEEEAPDRTVWMVRFGRGCGSVTAETTESMIVHVAYNSHVEN